MLWSWCYVFIKVLNGRLWTSDIVYVLFFTPGGDPTRLLWRPWLRLKKKGLIVMNCTIILHSSFISRKVYSMTSLWQAFHMGHKVAWARCSRRKMHIVSSHCTHWLGSRTKFSLEQLLFARSAVVVCVLTTLYCCMAGGGAAWKLPWPHVWPKSIGKRL